MKMNRHVIVMALRALAHWPSAWFQQNGPRLSWMKSIGYGIDNNAEEPQTHVKWLVYWRDGNWGINAHSFFRDLACS